MTDEVRLSKDESKQLCEAVKRSLTIESVLRSLWGEELRRNGIGFCPFHEHRRRTPSFHVKHSGAWFVCYSCGVKGDVVGFVRETFRRRGPDPGFRGALMQAAELAGLQPRSARTILLAAQRPPAPAVDPMLAILKQRGSELFELAKRCRQHGDDGAEMALWLMDRWDDLHREGATGLISVRLARFEAVLAFARRFAEAREAWLSYDWCDEQKEEIESLAT